MRANLIYRSALTVIALVSATLGLTTVLAADPKPPAKGEDIRVQLAKKIPGAKPEDVRPSAIAGIYEVAMGRSSVHITADGKYLISGDLYEIKGPETFTNLTDEHRSEGRIKSLATVKDADIIAFGPANAKHSITVFIDVDCGYCRKLHSEIAELNKLGVRVRYAAYPRSGPGTESWAKMEAVWCAKDRRSALTRSQLGEDIGAATCGATPVASQYRLGEEMGVDGTPAIFTDTGKQIGGYLPPQQLLAQLEELKGGPPAPKAARQ
jgi:thiol:disulfide interchange protein DsbC